MKNPFKKIWNSETFENIVDISFEVADAISEILLNTFNNKEEYDLNSGVSWVKKENHSTYDYWITLSYQEQFEYFHNNEYLKIYINDFYENDKEKTAKNVQRIADKLNKEFTNKNNRY